jgi:DNA primase
MSLFVDLKYLRLISNRLPLFKQKNDKTFNCRCVICGDSAKKKTKTRGYFYAIKNEMFYRCFNCDASMHFGSFLKTQDAILYSQYVLERYTEGLPLNKPHQKIEDKFKMEEPVFKRKSILDDLLDRLDSLPNDHEAVKFCEKRKIPTTEYENLYFIDDIRKIEQLSDKYKDKLTTSEPRLVIPFTDKDGQLLGVTCRALRNESLRYLTIKIKDEVPLVFRRDLDDKKDIYVVEGPLDSLFIKNSIAVAGTNFTKLDFLEYDKNKLVIVIDNQPRNKEVCKIINKVIDNGYRTVIWPQTLDEKDINDMVLAGKNPLNIIKKNTFAGLEAKAKFIAWKRC